MDSAKLTGLDFNSIQFNLHSEEKVSRYSWESSPHMIHNCVSKRFVKITPVRSLSIDQDKLPDRICEVQKGSVWKG